MSTKIIPILIIICACLFVIPYCMWYDNTIDSRATTETYSVSVCDYNDLVNRYNALADAYNTEIYKDVPSEIVVVESAPIVETINTARCFDTRNELIEWLALDDTDKQEYVKYYYNCQHFSRDLQRSALDDGYLINIELSDDHTHLLNSAYILTSGCMYYIEPQTDRVWLMAVLND